MNTASTPSCTCDDDLTDLVALAEEVAQPDFLQTYAALKRRLAETEAAGRVLAGAAVMQAAGMQRTPDSYFLIENLRASLVAALELLPADCPVRAVVDALGLLTPDQLAESLAPGVRPPDV